VKISVFLDKIPCSLLKVNCRFGGIYRLHLQVQRISQAINHLEAGSKRRKSPEESGGIYKTTRQLSISENRANQEEKRQGEMALAFKMASYTDLETRGNQ
jgi:hypothetical protein